VPADGGAAEVYKLDEEGANVIRLADTELDAHEDDPDRISPRTLNRLRTDYEDPRDLVSRRFGREYQEKVKAKIRGDAEVPESSRLATDSQFWKVHTR
jgi:hypothetical protein